MMDSKIASSPISNNREPAVKLQTGGVKEPVLKSRSLGSQNSHFLMGSILDLKILVKLAKTCKFRALWPGMIFRNHDPSSQCLYK